MNNLFDSKTVKYKMVLIYIISTNITLSPDFKCNNIKELSKIILVFLFQWDNAKIKYLIRMEYNGKF